MILHVLDHLIFIRMTQQLNTNIEEWKQGIASQKVDSLLYLIDIYICMFI